MTDETKKSDQAPRVAVLTPELQEPQEPARKQTDLEAAAEKEANEPRETKIERLIAGYEHGLASNSPRTSAELAEIKALLAP